MKKADRLFERRKVRTRVHLKENANGRIRLSVYRSNLHIYAQLIDDKAGKTLAQASTMDKDLGLKKGSTVAAATEVGKAIAKKALDLKIKQVVFDRGGYVYHGRVKALADSARESGLDF